MGSTRARALSRASLAEESPQHHSAPAALRHLESLYAQPLRSLLSRTPPVYPPISSIPHTTAARLAQPDALPSPFPTEPIIITTTSPASPEQQQQQHKRDGNGIGTTAAAAAPSSVLYLAYGSNMCASAFLGTRGIRPLSQVNVSAPSLRLTFDLPGLPYQEPCFANTALRKIPGQPPLPSPPKLPPGVPDIPPPPEWPPSQSQQWDSGLVGVVYEVTATDYRTIVATEGGGASYHEIVVPCFALPAAIGVPEKPPAPPVPVPFLARTLFAPRLPDVPNNNNNRRSDDGGDDDGDDDDKLPKPTLPPWARKLLLPVRRPEADYAQPSARYLQLLRDGAREHDLPAAYQAHLSAVAAYAATTGRQRLGRLLFLGFWMPFVLILVEAGRVLADDGGRVPGWLAATSAVLFNLVWISYDAVGKPLFLDGERTLPEDEEGRRRAAVAARRPWLARGRGGIVDEEKVHLLE
ncbi:hypothetical protein B0T24DRAFT_23012 [Lasiosphaeria ovina]|uniref:gamma-glutamylcyclotransferase n=1 Tax=Lasiosphaeria ovina TaxID=92902 RepID=A0AAE0NJX4_9PEZI|nr:hypothetical protein B0T24DRAFT_23012 [Lasiosphaeria ovina]